jgi:hypothetical protein
MVGAPDAIIAFSGRPASETVRISEATLNTVRCNGLRPPVRSVHCDHAPRDAMHTASAGPSASKAQKLIACDSDRFD